MNFLAHSMISLEIDRKLNLKKGTLYGNFSGDFYKGRIENLDLPEYIKKGLVLHRIIDDISDREGNLLNEILKIKFGIFKGIVSDIFIDHFLSKNFHLIFNENINDIEKEILYNIKCNEAFFTKDFRKMFEWLYSNNVLVKYSDADFLKKVFSGLSKRIKNGEILLEATEELEKYYSEFEKNTVGEFNYTKEKSIERFLKI